MERVQVILSAAEKAVFRRTAEQHGLSLSAWLRQAGLDRVAAAAAPVRFGTVEELAEFFARSDEAEPGREPDWEQHQEVMRRSRETGGSGT